MGHRRAVQVPQLVAPQLGAWAEADMSLQTLLCVTVLLCKLTGCLSIVGGRDAQRGAWPWMVYLEMHFTDNSSRKCGGSLISDQWVLTSCSCLKCRSKKVHLERSFAQVGELSLMEPSGRKVKLKRVVLHPDYRDDGSYNNDIALVQLQEAVSFSDTVQPVLLPSPRDQFSPHTECWVTGWGDVAKDREVERRLVQIGIANYEDGCGRKGFPGAYTHVFNHTQFIRDTIPKAECKDLPPFEACFL
ncbi:transmembrane protease serine 12-like [Sardina pilchardus]|uniref:transmembrane protease serine 12-like n=1 Tax=Sardina pilchardus TaxID=27697 RepID=UPI002E164278